MRQYLLDSPLAHMWHQHGVHLKIYFPNPSQIQYEGVLKFVAIKYFQASKYGVDILKGAVQKPLELEQLIASSFFLSVA